MTEMLVSVVHVLHLESLQKILADVCVETLLQRERGERERVCDFQKRAKELQDNLVEV